MSTTKPAAPTEYGEVFTRKWVVEFILDLVGYSSDRDLGAMVAVEPSCGGGAFLGPMVERLSESLRQHGRSLSEAAEAIRAFDLLPHHVETCQQLVCKLLTQDGWDQDEAKSVAAGWIQSGDYLLVEQFPNFADFVIGNPPYIRMDEMEPGLVAEYRKRCPTMTGRTDIYVGFFEVGLRSLRANGVLGFICADRWMRNQYGRHLRGLLSTSYALETTIVAHDVDAFEEQVSAYPAITVIRNAPQAQTKLVTTTAAFGEKAADSVLCWSQGEKAADTGPGYSAARLPGWSWGDESWPSGSPAQLALLEELNERFRPMEDREAGTRIGIGIATGADQVYVVGPGADIEQERLLPLVMSRDIRTGEVQWGERFLANPWADDGSLVDLDDFPRLRRYFEGHADSITGRNVAKRDATKWFRTIDKVDHELTARPKLLFPDMKMTSHPVIEPGGLYPHHNLYFIVSDQWDLEVLGGLLLSEVADFFISAYAVRMRGGTLRFQAQYLRRIRVPDPSELSSEVATELAAGFRNRDKTRATAAALRAYDVPELPT
jgi:adenine-specific DNA-methyltransferase